MCSTSSKVKNLHQLFKILFTGDLSILFYFFFHLLGCLFIYFLIYSFIQSFIYNMSPYCMHISVWTHGYILYTLGYNPTLLYLFCCSDRSIIGHWEFFQLASVPLVFVFGPFTSFCLSLWYLNHCGFFFMDYIELCPPNKIC